MMKCLHLIGFSMWFSLNTATWSNGQAPAGTTAASTNVRGAEYPRIHSDLKVTFRVKAPDAQKVEFQLGKRYPAKKDDNGFWTATSDPQAPGFHYYWLVIDGVQVNDPASETFYGVGKESSGIEVPGKGDQDGLIHISQHTHTYLKEKGVDHIWHVEPGGHNFPVWKNDLYLFSQRIFR